MDEVVLGGDGAGFEDVGRISTSPGIESLCVKRFSTKPYLPTRPTAL